MFWALVWYAVAYIGSGLIAAYYARKQKPERQPFEPPVQPVGKPVPVLFGTHRLTPIPTWFGGYTTFEIKKKTAINLLISTSVTIGYGYRVYYQGVLCWGALYRFSNMVFEEDKLLNSQPLTRQKFSSVTWSNPPVVNYTNKARIAGTDGSVFYVPSPTCSYSYFHLIQDGDYEYEVYLPQIFGGKEQGGGVEGRFTLHTGSGVQPRSAPMLLQMTDADVPRYRNLCYVTFGASTAGGLPTGGFYVGNSPTPPQIDFIITRLPEVWGANNWGLGTGTALTRNIVDPNDPNNDLESTWIQQDANPSHIIWECLTNDVWGLAIGMGELDQSNFYDNTGTLNTEEFGLSYVLSDQQTVGSFLDEVLETIDGVLRHHPSTGQLQVKLIRQEVFDAADLAALTGYDEGSIRSLTWSRRDWVDTINQVSLTFSNADRLYEDDLLIVQNEANIFTTGHVRAQSVHYRGITDRAVALRVAVRQLWAGSLRLGKGTLRLDRSAWALAQGDLFKLSYAKYGLTNVVCRVAEVDLGTLEDNTVEVQFIEDFFQYAAPLVAVTDTPPAPPVGQNNYEIPEVYELPERVGNLGQLTLAIFDPDSRMTKVEFQTKVGNAAAGSWTEDAAEPYVTTVALDLTYPSRIAWRVTYDDASGEDATITGEEEFAPVGQIISATDPGAVGAGALWLDTSGSEPVQKQRDATNTSWANLGATLSAEQRTGTISVTIQASSTGVKGAIGPFDMDLTLKAVTLLANTSGSCVLDLWSDTFGNYPPTVGDSICGSAKPTLSSSDHSQDTTLTGWTTTLAAGKILAVNVDSASGLLWVQMALKVERA